jgi:hypothetical protein
MIFLTKTDKFILLVATLVLAVFSYFLYDDSLLFNHEQNNSLAEIGRIYLAQNDVRVKSATSFAWSPGVKQKMVHERDTVFTGAGSEVAIQLEDGSIISLKENSLVSLNFQNGEMSLDLKYGDFVGQLAESSQLKVRAGKEEYKLKGEKQNGSEKAVIAFNKNRNGQLDVKLQSGSAQLVSKNESKKLEKQKSVLVADQGGIKEVVKPSITLATPDNITYKQWTSNDLVPLEWQSSAKSEMYEVEVSTDPNFKDVKWRQKTPDQKINANLKLDAGDYYWRVKALTKDGKILSTSSAHQVSILRPPGPKLILPEPDKELSYELKAGTPVEDQKAEFKMSWEADSRFKKFNYQVASDAEFKNLIKDGSAEESEAVPKVPSGTYYVRVRGVIQDKNFGEWSESRAVTININVPKEGLKAPVLINAKIKFNPQDEMTRNPAAVPAPTLKWTKPAGAHYYIVEFSKDKNFKQATDVKVTGEIYNWPEFSYGTTYYRVTAHSQDHRASPPSQVGVIDILLNDPKLKPLANLVISDPDGNKTPPPQEVVVQWTPIPRAKKYLLEMAPDKTFAKSTKFEASSASLPVQVPAPGNYAVRVKALNENGSDLSNFSEAQSFRYVFRVPLLTPVLASPFDGTTLFMQQDSAPFLWLEWNEVKNSVGYELEISDSPRFEKVVFTAQSKVPRFLVKEKIPIGKLYWRVRALAENPDMHSDWTAKRELSILFNKNETYR